MFEDQAKGLLGASSVNQVGATWFDTIHPSFALNLDLGSIKTQTATATFTRATTATFLDWGSVMRTAFSGEVRFQGLRRVANLIGTSSEDFTTWVPQNSGVGSLPTVTNVTGTNPLGQSGNVSRVQMALNGGTTAGDFSVLRSPNIPAATGARRLSVWLKSNTAATYDVHVRIGSGGVVVPVTPTWQRFSTLLDTSASDTTLWGCALRGTLGTSDSADILIWGAMAENVVGQSNQNPGEYVSVGVLSAPYHGANVDGVKYFPYQNGNTVSNNVVTESQGAGFPASAPVAGYLPEGARTNLALQSEDFSTTWTAVNLKAFGSGSTVNAAVAPDGNTTADLITEDTTVTAAHGVTQAFAKAASAITYTFSAFVKQAVGTRNVELMMTATGGGAFVYVNPSTGATVVSAATFGASPFSSASATIQSYPNGWYRITLIATSNTDTTLNTNVRLASAGSDSYTGDGTSGLYVWGAQLEQASFTSSYIPTTTASVTRNADVLTYPTSGWFSNTAGTFVTLAGPAEGNPSNGRIVGDGASANTPVAMVGSPAAVGTVIYDGTNNISGTGVNYLTGQVRAATSFDANGMSAVSNGGAVGTTASYNGAILGANVGIGHSNSTTHFNGPISRVAYYPQRLSNYLLQVLTK